VQAPKRYYFVGIGGSGMSPLSQILRSRGCWVGGSDRAYDRNQNRGLFRKLKQQGIELFPQNSDTPVEKPDFLVVSTAVEETNRELARARRDGIPVLHRADLLARLFNASRGIGIAGTSGKSTVTGMVAAVLDAAGTDPTVVNGGIIKQYASRTQLGNAKHGSSDIMVAEVDESDGSITRFQPRIAVVTNISKDHKELDELRRLFQIFADNTAGPLILNEDCPYSGRLGHSPRATFGLRQADNIRPDRWGSRFQAFGETFRIRMPGLHNVCNALAAIAVGTALGISTAVIRTGLASFRGIRRRLDRIGSRNGIVVVDDFAHNPEKISASLAALRLIGPRLLVVFQPHGYGPTRFLLNELGQAFSAGLRPTDLLVMLDIFDAGGTADRTITSQALLDLIGGVQRHHARTRAEAIESLRQAVRPGDVIAVMGARDDTLSQLAAKILRSL